jgi:hypothetical protein
MNLAPVALFVYNRISHTQLAVSALLNNQEACDTDLYIFSDGPKNLSDNENVNSLRKYLTTIVGFKSITIIEQEKNKGLANSIIDGVTLVVNKFEKIIVLEDDIVVSEQFLAYMNTALSLYSDYSEVASIHAYIYPVSDSIPNLFFLKGADCWGWATWKRAWDYFEPNGELLKDKLISEKLVSAFNFDDTYPFFKMLENQIDGTNNSWAIRWHASCYLNNLYTLYPGNPLITNIGFDNSGTHCGTDNFYNSKIVKVNLDNFPVVVIESIQARNAIKKFFLATNSFTKKNIFQRIISKINYMLKLN